MTLGDSSELENKSRFLIELSSSDSHGEATAANSSGSDSIGARRNKRKTAATGTSSKGELMR